MKTLKQLAQDILELYESPFTAEKRALSLMLMAQLKAKLNEPEPVFKKGDLVTKVGGDYHFSGFVVAKFKKSTGVTRYVVEDQHGVLHIYTSQYIR